MTREEAIRMLSTRDAHGMLCGYTSGYEEALDMAVEALQAKTSDKGEWIRWVVDIEDDTGVLYIPRAKCSNCGTEQDPYTTQFINYCPNCGCAMTKQHTKD